MDQYLTPVSLKSPKYNIYESTEQDQLKFWTRYSETNEKGIIYPIQPESPLLVPEGMKNTCLLDKSTGESIDLRFKNVCKSDFKVTLDRIYSENEIYSVKK